MSISEQNQDPQNNPKVTGTYQMLWDCPACGTKKLLGVSHKFCPNCGHPQDAKYRYFPSQEEQIAVQDHVYYGADKICPACNAPNSAKSEFCSQCGSSLEQAKQVELRDSQVVAETASFKGESKADAKRERELKSLAVPKTPETPATPFFKSKLAMGLMAGCVVVVSLVILIFFWKKTVEVVVSSHSWERSIYIEDYNWRRASNWCDSVPMGAVVLTRSREVRSYNKIAVGEKCVNQRIDQGDGSFRVERVCTPEYKELPVYDTKCYYQVLAWDFKRKVKKSGDNLTPEPVWPQLDLHNCSTLTPGCERESKREENYTVHFKAIDQEKSYQCNFSQQEWQLFQVATRYVAKASVFLDQLACDSLKLALPP